MSCALSSDFNTSVNGEITCGALNYRGTHFVFCMEGKVYVLDLTTRQIEHLTIIKQRCDGISVHGDNMMLFHPMNGITIWDISCLPKMRQLMFIHQSRAIITGGIGANYAIGITDRCVVHVNGFGGNGKTSEIEHNDWCRIVCCACSSKSNFIIYCLRDGYIVKMSLVSSLRKMVPHGGQDVIGCMLSADDMYFVIHCVQQISVWKVTCFDVTHLYTISRKFGSCKLLEGKTPILVAIDSKMIYYWKLATGVHVKTVKFAEEMYDDDMSLSFSENGKVMAISHSYGSLSFYRTKADLCRVVLLLKLHGNRQRSRLPSELWEWMWDQGFF